LIAIAAALDCAKITIESNKFDLSAIGGEVFTVNKSEPLPPTKNDISLYLSLCKPWKPLENIAKEDQCDDKTFICEIVTNVKENSKEKERVISVRPWGKEEAKVTGLPAEGVRLTFSGSRYNGQDLTAIVNIVCDKNIQKGKPDLVTVNSTTLEVNFKTLAGCKLVESAPGESSGQHMSGVGIFFLLYRESDT
ncbi:hypothetical protein HDU96_009116, partial [Phlyctochytrium bullatum]